MAAAASQALRTEGVELLLVVPNQLLCIVALPPALLLLLFLRRVQRLGLHGSSRLRGQGLLHRRSRRRCLSRRARVVLCRSGCCCGCTCCRAALLCSRG